MLRHGGQCLGTGANSSREEETEHGPGTCVNGLRHRDRKGNHTSEAVTPSVQLQTQDAFKQEARPAGSWPVQEVNMMNWDQVQGNWKQLRGQAQAQWGKLTDDDMDRIEGKRDQLVGKIQEAYGIGRDEAEREVDEWNRNLS